MYVRFSSPNLKMRSLPGVLCLVAAFALWRECDSNVLPAAASVPAAAAKPAAAASSEKDVQILTDSNFEQETQAVTGSTSGTSQTRRSADCVSRRSWRLCFCIELRDWAAQ